LSQLSRLNPFKVNFTLHNPYDRAFLLLLLADSVLRAIWLDKPDGSLIFDEWYYVNVARVILGIPQSLGANGLPPYQNVPNGLDPNHEHPPLAKLLIALSMRMLGDNGYGWRIPSVIFGVFAILIFYLLLKRISGYKFVPLLGAFLFSFDNLVFVHSRIATLDIFTVTFMILGMYWYFSGRPYLSAISMALSTLSKMTGVAGVVTVMIFHAVKFVKERKSSRDWSRYFSWFEKYIAVYALSFLLLLTIFDRIWVGYDSALPHLQYILSYSSALVSSCPNGIISCPWQWLINQVQIPYLVVNVKVTADNVTNEFNSITFWGAMNPSILYLTLPAIAYSAYAYLKQKKNDLALLSVIWFAVTYLPYYPLVLIGNRVVYLFYFLPTMPAVCASIAYMIADQNPPKLVVLFYLGVVLVSFYFLFPFKVIPT
jgi:predicted membrane-bound dolichyl-phosphate-mannose-protein mannosyltransferase